MTPAQFRRAALSLPDAIESAHGNHPDFRVEGKVFASLGYPDAAWGMVKLTPDQQALLIETTPEEVFVPEKGTWGLRGATSVRLAAVDAKTAKHALTVAWNLARKSRKRAVQTKTRSDKNATPLDSGGLASAFTRARAAAKASKLPGIEESTSYGTPSLTVRGKFLMRVKDADTLAFRCTTEEKAFLMEAEPSIYFETDHYVGWPIVLVRLSTADNTELVHCVERAWRLQAPKKLKAERANAHPARANRKPRKK